METRMDYYRQKVGRGIGITLFIGSLLAIAICMICDYFIIRGLDWSLIVMLSIVSFWMFIPFTFAKENSIRNALIVLSVICVPFLFALSQILDTPLVFTLGSGIAFVSCMGLWESYFIFQKYQQQKLLALGYFVLLTIPLVLSIVWLVDRLIESFVIHQGSIFFQLTMSLLIATSCFVMAYLNKANRK